LLRTRDGVGLAGSDGATGAEFAIDAAAGGGIVASAGGVFRTLHGGDSAPWRTAADALFAAGQGHREVADSTASAASGIDTALQDGAQQAGANTKLNSMLLGGLANDYSGLGTALKSYAEHRDTAVQNTPTPEEYDRARALLAQAQSTDNPILMAQAARQLAELDAQAAEAQLGYQSNVADTTAQHGGAPTTSNNIAGGNPNQADTHIGNVGDAVDANTVPTFLEEFATDVSGGSIADCAHWLPEERASETATAILDFLAENRRADPHGDQQVASRPH
jgi:hypothetical protein